MDYGKHLNPRNTPQTKPIPGKPMVKNEAGGFGFKKDPWTQLRNFLILGSEGGTYYVGERELTLANAQAIMDCLKLDGNRVLNEIIEVSQNGLAPKNDPAIFALALICIHGEDKVKHAARASIRLVCRTGTHLFTFMQAYKDLCGKTSRSIKRGISDFYMKREPAQLAQQLIKYRQRNGWTHRDVLRLARPKGKPGTPHGELLRWAAGKEGATHPLIEPFLKLQATTEAKTAAHLIHEFKLPWEAVPTELLKERLVWEALLPGMGITALLRNLGKLTSLGFFASAFSEDVKYVERRFGDVGELRRGRLHPFQILLAYSTYAAGKGVKGSLSWTPNSKVLDALDSAFFNSFLLVEPTEKKIVVGIDVSGSMSGATVNNTSLTCAQAAFLMAMIHLRTEPNVAIVPFDTDTKKIHVPTKGSLAEYLRLASFHGGGTDCAVPFKACANIKDVDAFLVYTDSQTWAGQEHPCSIFREWKRHNNPHAVAIGVEMASTATSITDPSEPGMHSVIGMDASVPAIVSRMILEGGQQ